MNKKLIRQNFVKEVLIRDNHRCRICGDNTSKLDVHHIIDRKEISNGGYVSSNGITLCDKENGCHIKAEQYHRVGKAADGFSPDDLFVLIGSSKEKAFADSENLL